ncbi:MAG TPA: 50S ribosomal protein L35 [Abditibacteriaceae bacterium]|jgi:large subunit ribosomal protein L35
MGKMKTRKAAAKRMTLTATGKIKHRRAGLTHLQSKRSSRTQSRNNNGAQSVSKSDYKSALRMMPHAQ